MPGQEVFVAGRQHAQRQPRRRAIHQRRGRAVAADANQGPQAALRVPNARPAGGLVEIGKHLHLESRPR